MTESSLAPDVLYRYTGPTTGATLAADESRGLPTRDVMLHAGEDVALPAWHPYVQTLVALNRLTTVPPAPIADVPKPKTKERS